MVKSSPLMTAPSAPSWDQKGFDAFYAALPEERRADDEKRLSDVFNFAANVPIAKAALAWAADNGVKFFVDHKDDQGGSMTTNMGVVAISDAALRAEDMPQMMNILVHEIEHMWQDSLGYAERCSGGFLENWLSMVLIESDATAHGLAAKRQAIYYLAGLQIEGSPAESPQWRAFQAWSHSSWIDDYTVKLLHEYMEDYGLSAEEKPGDDAEDSEDEEDVLDVSELDDVEVADGKCDGLHILSPRDVFNKLGRGFLQKNYFDPVAAPRLFRELKSAKFINDYFDEFLPEEKKSLEKVLAHERKLIADMRRQKKANPAP